MAGLEALETVESFVKNINSSSSFLLVLPCDFSLTKKAIKSGSPYNFEHYIYFFICIPVILDGNSCNLMPLQFLKTKTQLANFSLLLTPRSRGHGYKLPRLITGL